MSTHDTAPEPESLSHARSRGLRREPATLITGANGEVGHGLIRALHARGETNIIAMDIRDLDPHLRSFVGEVCLGDICDRALLNRLLARFEITTIFHLAAMLSTRGEYTPETAHEINVTGTMNLLRLAEEQARSHGKRVKFIYPSTIAVYGLPDLETKRRAGRVGEDQFCTPITMYGCNKLYCEHLGRYYGKYYRQLAKDRSPDGIDFRCLRYPGLISAETVPSGGTSDYAPEMIHAAAQGKAYECFVRPDAQIPFLTMPEAIRATLMLAEAPAGSLTRLVYNISGFSPSAESIEALTKKAFPGAGITYKPDVQRQQIVDSWPADVDAGAARRDWGFYSAETLESALEGYVFPAVKARYGRA